MLKMFMVVLSSAFLCGSVFANKVVRHDVAAPEAVANVQMLTARGLGQVGVKVHGNLPSSTDYWGYVGPCAAGDVVIGIITSPDQYKGKQFCGKTVKGSLSY